MVRKRSRKYESDDNDSDSDLDFDFDEATQQPAAKKYSLRERKRTPMFTTDYDYYGLDEDDELKKHSSDDEDFEVEADVDNVDTSRGYYESDSGPQNSEGLIDFEDIIRADIVVNKNKIDYDNIIQKTEIKLTQPPKRRGRKPKNYVEPKLEPKQEPKLEPKQETATENDCTYENEMQTLERLEEKDNEENKGVLKTEIDFCEGQVGIANGDMLENLGNGDSDKLVNNETDPLAMKNASNDNVVVKPPPIEENVVRKEEAKPVDDDDDVIILGEADQDVIVLDD